MESQLRALGVEPNVVFRSDDNGTVQRFVGASLAAAVVPELTVDLDDPAVAALPLGRSMMPRLIGVAWHRDRHRSQLATRFVELAEEVCRDLGARRQAAPSSVA